jgi:hypothetical protein
VSSVRARTAVSVLAIAAGLGCSVASPATGFELGPREPIKQFNDTVRTYARQPVAALHVTADAGDLAELTWAVATLPCAGQHFRMDATEGVIAGTQASNRELDITIVAAHFTHGIRCHSKLPSAANEGSAVVTVKPAERDQATGGPVNVYEDSETKIESFSSCVTLAGTCAGRYVLRAYLDAPRLHATLEYVFETAPDGPSAVPEGAYERLQPLFSVIERLEQCPVSPRVG